MEQVPADVSAGTFFCGVDRGLDGFLLHMLTLPDANDRALFRRHQAIWKDYS